VLGGFTDQFARLNEDYDRVVEMLQASGFEPPAQFRRLTEFSLGHHFEQEIAKQQRSHDPLAYKRAIEIASMAAKRGYRIEKTVANESFGAMINDVVNKAVERPSRLLTNAALDLVTLSRRLDLEPNLEWAQERIYQAFLDGVAHAGQLARLAGAFGLAHSAIRRSKISGRAVENQAAAQQHSDGEGTSQRRQPRPRAN
jgi:hypothetical protein